VSTASGDISSSRSVRAPLQEAPRRPPPQTRSESVSPLIPGPAKIPQLPAEAADFVDVDGGVLVLRVVPDDNSCLFSSVAVVFEQDMKAAPRLRQVVADTIRNNPILYDDTFLGQSLENYISTIMKPTSWGGAIELSIFSDHYKTEISSFDVETGRCDRFGEGQYDNRCILMYSGIHYDAVSLSPTHNAPLDFHQTVFPVTADMIFDAASKLATKKRLKREYTNTTTFDLRCQVCGKGLKGEKEAREHAKETTHVEFGEY